MSGMTGNGFSLEVLTCWPGLNNKLLLHRVVLTYICLDFLHDWPVLNLHDRLAVRSALQYGVL